MKDSIQYGGPVLDCPDAERLAGFYAALLGWQTTFAKSVFVGIGPRPNATRILFQTVDDYQEPVWPAEADKQQQMAHLDFVVDDLDRAVAVAVELGARVNPVQSYAHLKIMLDPAGHPFCLIRKDAWA